MVPKNIDLDNILVEVDKKVDKKELNADKHLQLERLFARAEVTENEDGKLV